jgi:hypothetical protein
MAFALLPRARIRRDDAGIAFQEHLHGGSGGAQAVGQVVQPRHAFRGDVVGPPGRPGARAVPLRAYEPVALEPAQRAVDGARIALAVVHRAQPNCQVIAVIGLFPQEQQQARLKEVPRLELRHEAPQGKRGMHPDGLMLPSG